MRSPVRAPVPRLTCGFGGPARSAAITPLIALLAATCSAGTITFTEAGTSAAGTPLLVSARLDTAADAGGPNNLLRITLRSFGAATVSKSDVLSSFYFTIADPCTGIRPALTYVSGSGQAYQVRTNGMDKPVSWTPNLVTGTGTWTTAGPGANDPSNLVAMKPANEGWQFRTFSPPPGYPGLEFGIGTVGNSDIDDFIPGATAGFTPQVVSGAAPGSMINLGIYSTGTGTDIAPDGGLNGSRLVRTEAVFTFMSDRDLASLAQNWIQGHVAFGFGTGPDSVLLPEPSGLTLAALAGLCAAVWQLKRKTGWRLRENRGACSS